VIKSTGIEGTSRQLVGVAFVRRISASNHQSSIVFQKCPHNVYRNRAELDPAPLHCRVRRAGLQSARGSSQAHNPLQFASTQSLQAPFPNEAPAIENLLAKSVNFRFRLGGSYGPCFASTSMHVPCLVGLLQVPGLAVARAKSKILWDGAAIRIQTAISVAWPA
jgi:hypothetical protein